MLVTRAIVVAACLSACSRGGFTPTPRRGDAGTAVDATTVRPAHCTLDEHCDDRLSCAGVEHCDPADPSADSRGCVAGNGGSCVVTALGAGRYHSCGFVSGSLSCWGDNRDHQLGDGIDDHGQRCAAPPRDCSRLPVTAPIAAPVLSVGSQHGCAIAKGKLLCWGNNNDGELGDGTTSDSGTPVAIDLAAVSAVDTGGAHTCALADGGAVYCWGNNNDGQLADGTTTDRALPTDTGIRGATIVAAGGNHSCAVSDTGAVYCWGRNGSGQRGDGTQTARHSPVDTGLRGASALSLGDDHSCAIVAGAVYCWGANSDGQLGDGTTSQRTSPTQVALASASLIAAGGRHTCALTTDGLYCWGRNSDGQLGDETQSRRPQPTAIGVGVLSAIQALAAGSDHTCAAGAMGAFCWGSNSRGQLGDGTTGRRLSPTRVAGL